MDERFVVREPCPDMGWETGDIVRVPKAEDEPATLHRRLPEDVAAIRAHLSACADPAPSVREGPGILPFRRARRTHRAG